MYCARCIFHRYVRKCDNLLDPRIDNGVVLHVGHGDEPVNLCDAEPVEGVRHQLLEAHVFYSGNARSPAHQRRKNKGKINIHKQENAPLNRDVLQRAKHMNGTKKA